MAAGDLCSMHRLPRPLSWNDDLALGVVDNHGAGPDVLNESVRYIQRALSRVR